MILTFGPKVFKFKTLILSSLYVQIVGLVFLPFVVFIPGLFGFLLTCLILFVLGLFAGAKVNSIFSILGFIPINYKIAITTSIGLSGLITNIIKLLIILLLDGKSILSKTLVLHSITIIIILTSIISTFVIFKSEEFRLWLKFSGEFNSSEDS